MTAAEREADRFIFDLSAEDALDAAESERARYHIRQAMQHEIARRAAR